MKNVYGVVSATAVAQCAKGFVAAWLFGLAVFCSPTYAASAIPVAVVPCATCGTAADLQSTARAYANQWIYATPPGYVGIVQDAGACTSPTLNSATAVLVVSTEIAISGDYYACWRYPHGVGVLEMIALTGGSNADAVSADNLLMARALANSGRLVLPPNLPFVGDSASFDVLWNEWVSNVGLHLDTVGQTEFWHGILDMLTPMYTATYTNEQTGEEFQVWAGDVITVTDSSGYTAKFEYTPGAPTDWTYVPNSIRDPQGNSVPNTGANLPAPGGTPQPTGPYNVSLPVNWDGLGPGVFFNFFLTPNFGDQTPGGEVIVGPVSSDNPVGYVACVDLTCT